MKILRKINKGLILSIIVITILVIYIVTTEMQRNKEKTNIEESCKSYIELVNKYAVLPEDKQKLYNAQTLENEEEKNKINNDTNDVIKKQLEELKSELKNKMIDNEIAINMQENMIEQNLKSSNNVFSSITTNYNKEIVKITKFAFDEDQVTVTFNSKTDIEKKYLGIDSENPAEIKELTKKENSDNPQETITLQKIGNSWKVVYADLVYNNVTINAMTAIGM